MGHPLTSLEAMNINRGGDVDATSGNMGLDGQLT
jgi:hypothetical protein